MAGKSPQAETKPNTTSTDDGLARPRKKSKWDQEGPLPAVSSSSTSLPGFHASQLARTVAIPSSTFKVLTIPATKKGALIGKNGEHITLIRHQTGAEIKISHTDGDPYATVSISGNVELVERLIAERLAESERNRPGQWEMKIVDVPQELIGQTIGPGGCNLRSMSEQSGCRIKFVPAVEVDTQAPAGKQVAVIRGPPERLGLGQQVLMDRVIAVQAMHLEKNFQRIGKGTSLNVSGCTGDSVSMPVDQALPGVVGKGVFGMKQLNVGKPADPSLNEVSAVNSKGVEMTGLMASMGTSMHQMSNGLGVAASMAEMMAATTMGSNGIGIAEMAMAGIGADPMGIAGMGGDADQMMNRWAAQFADGMDASNVAKQPGMGAGDIGPAAAGIVMMGLGNLNSSEPDSIRPKKGGGKGTKAIPCRFQMRGAGMCRNGDQCQFSHDPDMIAAAQGTVGSVMPNVTSNGYKMTYCRFFDSGKCTRGATCTFAHGVNELRGGLTPENLKIIEEAQAMVNVGQRSGNAPAISGCWSGCLPGGCLAGNAVGFGAGGCECSGGQHGIGNCGGSIGVSNCVGTTAGLLGGGDVSACNTRELHPLGCGVFGQHCDSGNGCGSSVNFGFGGGGVVSDVGYGSVGIVNGLGCADGRSGGSDLGGENYAGVDLANIPAAFRKRMRADMAAT